MYTYGTNRYICEVLREMRKCYETRNFSYLLGLIEEAQTLANRMEAAIQDVGDLKELHQKISTLKVTTQATPAAVLGMKGEPVRAS